MLYHLIVTTTVLFALMGLWLLVQRWERHQRGEAEACDVLASRVGCHGCILTEHCSLGDSGGPPPGGLPKSRTPSPRSPQPTMS